MSFAPFDDLAQSKTLLWRPTKEDLVRVVCSPAAEEFHWKCLTFAFSCLFGPPGIVRFRNTKAADQAMFKFKSSEIVVQDVAVQCKFFDGHER